MITKRIVPPDVCIPIVVDFIETGVKLFAMIGHSFPGTLQEISDGISSKNEVRISVEVIERDLVKILEELQKRKIHYQMARNNVTGITSYRFYLK